MFIGNSSYYIYGEGTFGTKMFILSFDLYWIWKL